jgi:hypothetical protein
MKPALIIGSGPSVDRLDPAVFDHFVTYGCNSVYKKFDEWGRGVDNVIITDSNRLQEIGDAYASFKGGLYIGDQRYVDPPRGYYRRLLGRDFVPLRQLSRRWFAAAPVIRKLPVSKYLSTFVFDKWRMTFDLEQGLNFGRSVSSSAVQLAAINGHSVILLTGIDASYPEEKAYFGAMRETIRHVNRNFVNNPRLMMEPYFVMAQIYFEQMGVRLVDCTPGGKLRFIEKGDFLQFVQ